MTTAFFACFTCPVKRTFVGTPRPGSFGHGRNHFAMSRKPVHEIKVQDTLQKPSINLVSLTEHIDTTTATGKLFFQFIAMLAEFERNLISERTIAGLDAARARGHVGGRPKVKPTETKVVIAKQLHASNTPIKTILKTLNIKKSTFYRYLNMEE